MVRELVTEYTIPLNYREHRRLLTLIVQLAPDIIHYLSTFIQKGLQDDAKLPDSF